MAPKPCKSWLGRWPSKVLLDCCCTVAILKGTTGNSSTGNNRLVGGLEAEQKAREEYQAKAQEEESADFEALQAIRRESFRKASHCHSPDCLTAAKTSLDCGTSSYIYNVNLCRILTVGSGNPARFLPWSSVTRSTQWFVLQRRESLGLPPGDTDPFYDTLAIEDLQVRLSACANASFSFNKSDLGTQSEEVGNLKKWTFHT